MVLTEVVLEASDPQCLLCRCAQPGTNVWAVLRVADPGLASGYFRGTITVAGPAETRMALLREMKDSGRYDELEVLSLNPYSMSLRVGHKLPESHAAFGIALAPLGAILDAFGPDLVLEPLLVEGGRVRIRFILARALETKRVILGLQEAQRAAAWKHFRVIRVGEFHARRYADVLRRILTPEQEDLLRIALTLGYYDTPKGCTLEDIARKVGLSVSPVHKKLKNIEQLLVTSHVAPGTIPADLPRRPRLPAPATEAGGMAELTLRVRWPGNEWASFAARTPGARVVYQPLGEDPREKSTSALAVVVADPRETRDALEHLAKRPDVLDSDVVSRDAEHVTLRVRTTTPPETGWGSHANPMPRLLARLGRDAFAKPGVLEGADVWLKIVFVQNPGHANLAERLPLIADEAGWADYEVVALRSVEPDLALSNVPYSDKITPRQEDVLKISHALGYYKTPRDCTLEDIARTLGTSANAIHKNLTAAEQKIVFEYLASSL